VFHRPHVRNNLNRALGPTNPARGPINPALALTNREHGLTSRALALINPALALTNPAPGLINPALALTNPALGPINPVLGLNPEHDRTNPTGRRKADEMIRERPMPIQASGFRHSISGDRMKGNQAVKHRASRVRTRPKSIRETSEGSIPCRPV
jgi:hypothetical protein